MTKVQNTPDINKCKLTVDMAELQGNVFVCQCYIDGYDEDGQAMERRISWEAVEKESDLSDFNDWYWENRYSEDLYMFAESAINKAEGRTELYQQPAPLPEINPFDHIMVTMEAAMAAINFKKGA